MAVYEIIKQLENTPSTNDKLKIIGENKDNNDLKDFFYYCLAPEIVYYIKKIPDYEPNNQVCLSLSECMSSLKTLANREHTGNDAIIFLKDILQNTHYENADLIERIIKKDPNCKVAVSSVNKIWPGLIKEYPVALCERNTEKNRKNIVFPAYSQCKEDGMRVNIHVRPDKVEYRTRNGKALEFNDEVDLIFKSLGSGFVYDGEALVVDKNDNILPRKIGNGILNKAVKNTISEKEKNQVVFHLWDMIDVNSFWDGKCYREYSTRLKELQKRVNGVGNKRVQCIDNYEINSWEEAKILFQQHLNDGKEGIIVKNKLSIWENKRLKAHIKLKAENDADLLCVGVEPHSKNKDMIGSLILETSCGKLRTSCGSGLKDKDRLCEAKTYLDKIIEIKYNEIITKEGEDIKSLFLPIFKRVRLDKDKANSLEELK